MSLLRVFATCTVICVLSALSLQAQKATCTNWNTWLLNPANPSSPSAQEEGVNDNRTVVGLALFSASPPKFWGFVHFTNGKSLIGVQRTPYLARFLDATMWETPLAITEILWGSTMLLTCMGQQQP